ncbi:hypothetical protein FSP39_021420 [Pinctada imbricata]|uniref:Cysteine protease n=1 Tax=Pinctada imbricata TaxID=66713 RepID=A0AA88XXL7_PINIB|nr:hypothetical protein FSP39_021420 [Pinctada imbricata]
MQNKKKKQNRTEQTPTERDAKRDINSHHRNIKHKRSHINQQDQWVTGADLKRPSATEVADDREDLKLDLLTRLWFTYRKNFAAIGGTGPTSDAGWGCMLRCGQMMLAQALVLRHLGRDWRWKKDSTDEKYWKILRMFQDKKSATYSIHQIAYMGVSDGKSVGQWFGPNTVAQVLKKLVIYDEWSSLVIHVAMDNTVIEDDIRCLCKPSEQSNCDIYSINKQKLQDGAEGHTPKQRSSRVSHDKHKGQSVDVTKWKPLLLFIPLRLGLTDINSVYFESLKICLSFRQSVGIIGGKPNHAHWFVGYTGNKVVYLDPHTTQPFEDLDVPSTSDEHYHIPYPCMMNISELDPSVALGFYCSTEEEFNDLCLTIQKFIILSSRTPMFELHKERPSHWPKYESYNRQASGQSGNEFTVVEGENTDEEFELVG